MKKIKEIIRGIYFYVQILRTILKHRHEERNSPKEMLKRLGQMIDWLERRIEARNQQIKQEKITCPKCSRLVIAGLTVSQAGNFCTGFFCEACNKWTPFTN